MCSIAILIPVSGMGNKMSVFQRIIRFGSQASLKKIVSQLRRLPLVPLFVITIILVLAIFADVIAPYSPYETSLPNRLLPPFWQEGGNSAYLLGTDLVGRDILSRIIHGARASLTVAALALVMGAGIGTVIGLISGYSGAKVDALLMRATDIFISFPIILIALLLAVALGPSLINVVVAIGVVLWARYARVIRGETLSVKERDFVAFGRISGCSQSTIIYRHIFPNVVNTLTVLISLQVGWVIIVEATLSFLGAGIPAPTPAWGSMIAGGRDYVTDAYWLSFYPGLAIAATVLSFNLFGDWLRDNLDPKLRQV